MVLGCLLLSLGLGTLPLTVGEAPAYLMPALLTSLFFVAVGTGLVTPSAAGFVSRVTSPEDQGRALGYLQSTASTARILGPVAFGVVSDLGGVRAPFMIAALLAAIAMIPALRAERLERDPGAGSAGAGSAGASSADGVT